MFDEDIVNTPFLEAKHFLWIEYNNTGNSSSNETRGQSAATRFADAAKKSGIFRQSPSEIKSASRQSLPQSSRQSLPQAKEEAKPANRQSSDAEREAKRARKAERNRRKANAAKRRG